MESTILLIVTALLALILVALFFGYREIAGLGARTKRLEMDVKALANRAPTWMHPPPPPPPQGGFSETIPPPAVYEDDDVAYFNDDDEIIVEDASSSDDEPDFEDVRESEPDHFEEVGENEPDFEDVRENEPELEEVDNVPEEVQDEQEEPHAPEQEFTIQPVPPKRKSGKPDESARDYDEGFEMISPNDGETYVVREDKAGRKRWAKTG